LGDVSVTRVVHARAYGEQATEEGASGTMSKQAVSIRETSFRGEHAVTLHAGALDATFLPDLGMTGVSLRLHGREYLALPGGLDALRNGHTVGLPLLAPWANRLASRRYRAAGITVDLRRRRLSTDEHGLPVHGLLLGRSGWQVIEQGVRAGAARIRAAIDVDAPAFPFPHRLDLTVIAREARLEIVTTLIPTGRRRVPVAFGWHPILRLPDGPRSRWRLRLPARRHLALDAFGLPTGASVPEKAENAPIGRRTFDDLYALGRDHRFALSSERGGSIEMRSDASYPFGQVWAPPGRSFAALEPMTVATNALVRGDVPLATPGDFFSARFTIEIRGPDSTA
jgi:aldose 1-epimerase